MFQTEIIIVDPQNPSSEALEPAARLLRDGGLVAFPTETVYGLGANALDDDAVQSIFTAKGRPSTNPVIVHCESTDACRNFAAEWPEAATKLAHRFWPGPLTLVLPRVPEIPDSVTAGGETVALRVPSHPVARALIAAVGCPVAAPSANRSMFISPTTAGHVLKSLNGRIPLIVDGGSAPGGIESTVIDLSVSPPKLLRPGLISIAALRQVIGEVQDVNTPDEVNPLAKSPGMMLKHYAPNTRMEMVPDGLGRYRQLRTAGLRAGAILLENSTDEKLPDVEFMPSDPADYARDIYAVMHRLDEAGLDIIIASDHPPGVEWQAVRDRLRRACWSIES